MNQASLRGLATPKVPTECLKNPQFSIRILGKTLLVSAKILLRIFSDSQNLQRHKTPTLQLTKDLAGSGPMSRNRCPRGVPLQTWPQSARRKSKLIITVDKLLLIRMLKPWQRCILLKLNLVMFILLQVALLRKPKMLSMKRKCDNSETLRWKTNNSRIRLALGKFQASLEERKIQKIKFTIRLIRLIECFFSRKVLPLYITLNYSL